MGDIPPGITGELRDRIHAGLLRIDAARQSRSAPSPKLAECLETAYDVFARELLRAGRQLTGAVLAEISTWVFQWAWGRWLFTMQPKPAWPGYFTMGDSGKLWQRDDAGLVVEVDGTPPASVLDAFEPLSEAGLKAGVRKSLEGRVIWWQAEALMVPFQEQATPEADLQVRGAEIVADLIADWQPEARATRPARRQHTSAADVPEIVACLDRVVGTQNITLERWAREHHISRTGLFDWRGAGGKAVKGRVSTDKAIEIEDAVRRDALRLGLILPHTDSD